MVRPGKAPHRFGKGATSIVMRLAPTAVRERCHCSLCVTRVGPNCHRRPSLRGANCSAPIQKQTSARTQSATVRSLPSRPPCGMQHPRTVSRFTPRSTRRRPMPAVMTLCIVGFDDLVTSFVAAIATGWSDPCRVGLSPTGKPRLYAAHEKGGLTRQGRHLRCGSLRSFALQSWQFSSFGKAPHVGKLRKEKNRAQR
jgi:hypothetical protein